MNIDRRKTRNTGIRIGSFVNQLAPILQLVSNVNVIQSVLSICHPVVSYGYYYLTMYEIPMKSMNNIIFINETILLNTLLNCPA